jgi:hypothetical protein
MSRDLKIALALFAAGGAAVVIYRHVRRAKTAARLSTLTVPGDTSMANVPTVGTATNLSADFIEYLLS